MVTTVAAQSVASRPGVIPASLPVAAVQTVPSLTPSSDPGTYYAAAQGKQGAALLHSLGEIVRTGHTDSGYAQARDGLFQLVSDPDRTDHVVDIYTGKSIANITDRKTAFSRGLNTEHTWPQSKGARGIAQSDLHQLMPSDIKINGLRGNMAYGEVTNPSWTSSNNAADRCEIGSDASGETVFEPRPSVKGDIARGLLYFYTRYNESRPADYTLENFRHELPVLLQWAAQDPVDDFEKHRNEDVFAIQHNRNPFIDHPEWVQAAFGGLTPTLAR